MNEVVTSVHNARVAAARKLLRSKERAAARAFLAEGPHAVGEALGSGSHAVRELFVTPGAAQREVALLRSAAAAQVPVTLVSDRVLAALGDTVTPQGVTAVVGMPQATLDAVLARRTRLVVVLCAVADPGNAGAVIRTADAAGADAVVLTSGSVDPFNGKCVRATAGSLFHLPVICGVGVPAVIDACRAAGLTVVATRAEAQESIDDPDVARALGAPTAWLFGNEARGLDDGIAAGADRSVRVPIHGRAESLNLAAAVAVCLYAAAREQRRAPP